MARGLDLGPRARLDSITVLGVFMGGAALDTERVKKRKQPRIAYLKKPHRNQIGEIERCRNAGGLRPGPS